MAKQFQPPIAHEQPRTLAHKRDRFWEHIRRAGVGASVLKYADGSYKTIETPSMNQMEAAVFTYQGGHIYPISDDEAAALTAAGYTVEDV